MPTSGLGCLHIGQLRSFATTRRRALHAEQTSVWPQWPTATHWRGSQQMRHTSSIALAVGAAPSHCCSPQRHAAPVRRPRAPYARAVLSGATRRLRPAPPAARSPYGSDRVSTSPPQSAGMWRHPRALLYCTRRRRTRHLLRRGQRRWPPYKRQLRGTSSGAAWPGTSQRGNHHTNVEISTKMEFTLHYMYAFTLSPAYPPRRRKVKPHALPLGAHYALTVPAPASDWSRRRQHSTVAAQTQTRT